EDRVRASPLWVFTSSITDETAPRSEQAPTSAAQLIDSPQRKLPTDWSRHEQTVTGHPSATKALKASQSDYSHEWLTTFSQSRLVIVTATTNPPRAMPCLRTWGAVPTLALVNGRSPQLCEDSPANIGWLVYAGYLGVVPAFSQAVQWALKHS